jgi:metal-sulfur cluster biosynthetic enzyme
MNEKPVNPHTGQPLPDEALKEGERAADASVSRPEGSAAEPTAAGVGPGAPSEPAPPAASGSVASAAPSQQELAIRSALESVMDPEIMLSVVDLGLIREIHLLPDRTFIRMMLTTPFCPYAPQLMEDVKQAAMGVVPQPCEVEIMPDPWSPDLMPDPGLLGYSF